MTWVLASLVLLVTGLLKGINLITLLACFMVSLALFNYVLARRQVRGLRGRRLLLEPIFACTSATFFVELHNVRRRRRLGLILIDAGAGQETRWFVPAIEGKATHKVFGSLTLGRRGLHTWGPLLVRTGYPLGLARTSRILAAGRELIVLPPLGQLQRGVFRCFLLQSSPSLGQSLGRPRQHRDALTEYHGLRQFQHGDSPRWIHWRTSARRGELMVREFEEMPSDNLVLLVEPWLPEPSAEPAGPDPHALLEIALCLAATVCWEWCRQKGDHLVLGIAGPEPIVLSGVTGQDLALSMLECLAVQAGCAAVEAQLLLDRLQEADVPSGPVLLVTTHSGGLEEVLAMGLHRPVACINVADGMYHDFFEAHPSLLDGKKAQVASS
jgi:uncharacterized protein (DUF58 family)